LPQARELILRAEESGYLLGDAARRAAMLDLLDEAERLLGVQPPAGATGAGRAAAAATVSQEKPGMPPGTAARKATAPAKKKPPKRRR
jgi:hypothetical protein